MPSDLSVSSTAFDPIHKGSSWTASERDRRGASIPSGGLYESRIKSLQSLLSTLGWWKGGSLFVASIPVPFTKVYSSLFQSHFRFGSVGPTAQLEPPNHPRAKALPTAKVCEVRWSGPHQGLRAHVDRYRNSPASRPRLARRGVVATGGPLLGRKKEGPAVECS